MGTTQHPRMVRTALLCGAAALTLPLAACSTSGNAKQSGNAADAPQTIQQLATKTGCTLAGVRKADQLQQGNCQNGQGRYVLVSFDTDTNKNAWLEEAKPWGGSYLVGTQWVAVATPQILEGLKKDLGGQVVSGEHNMSNMPSMNHS